MSKKTKSGTDSTALTSIQAERQFGITLKELENLMQTRGSDGVKQLQEVFGGINGLEQKLKTNSITGNEHQQYCI